MSFSRLLRFFSDRLSITSSNSSAPKKEESSSNSPEPKKEESSSNSSAPKIMVSTSTSSIALLGVMLMASSTFIYYFYSKASSSNSSEQKNEESSSNSSEQESSSNSSAPEKEEYSSNSSEQKKEESSSNSSEPNKEESSSNSSEQESSSNSSEPKKEESSSNSSEQESSSNSYAPKKEESSSNSSAPKKEESSSNSSAPEKEESSSNSSAPEKEESSSNSSEPKVMASTSTTPIQKRFKYDVFISFRGEDTRKTFVSHLYQALKDKGIYTYKDDEKMKQGKTIDNQLIQAIKDSRFFIIVFSKNYASSSWCLDELVEIMECQKTGEQTAYPVFFHVEPTQVRKQNGAFGEAFLQNKNKDAAGKWIEALKGASNLVGRELQATANGHEAKFIKTIVQEILLELRPINSGFDKMLVGMETRVKDVVSSLEMGIDDVRMIGIKGMGGVGKTTTSRAVFDRLSADFEAKSFVENVREVSKPSMSGLKKLQKQVLSDVLKEDVTVTDVNDGKNTMQKRMQGIKVLLVLDDVNHRDQLEALAGVSNWFKPGSRIIVTTRNEQVLVEHRVKWIPDIDLLSDEQVLEAKRVNVIRDIALLSEQEAISLFSRYAFGREIPSQGYKELSGKVLRYAAGLPLTLKVLGSFLCGKDEHEWKDAIERLKEIPLKETQEKLELSYTSLEKDYKEIFLDIACILKGKHKEDAIRILECCGFRAINGLKVLEQRSLITVNEDGFLGMHDHIEEMGKNIVRREHPNEPNKHSRLWINEEIEDILANDEGTEETSCLKLNNSTENAIILMKGFGKMKKLRYLEVNFASYSDAECLDDTRQYFPNSLKYIKCLDYPFSYLPETFQANNLVGLEMKWSRMVQLWKDGEKKVLKKLKFLSLTWSDLTTFDFRMTPNLETLSLKYSHNLVELCMPVTCQKLKHLFISKSKLKTFDLELTPNLESLSLAGCDELVEINAPAGCLKKVVYLKVSGCLRYTDFICRGRSWEPKDNCSSATLDLTGKSLDLCPLHPNSNLPKLQFRCYYDEHLPSSVGNIEKLMSFGLCACTDFKKISDIICSLKCLKELTLQGIPEFHKDIGQLESLEELRLYSQKIKHLPDTICMLNHLKYLKLSGCALLEKLPEDLGRLECLKELDISGTCISHLPRSIFGLKGLHITASSELLQLYDFPSEIKTRTLPYLMWLENQLEDVVSSLEMGIDDDVWMIGIKGMGGAGKTTTARAVFDRLSADFEAKSFVENVREVSEPSISGLKKLQEQVLSRVLNEQVTLDSVYDGKNMMQKRMQGIKVLLVLDDVNHIDQLVALAGQTNWFKKGSRIIVTTRDEQVLQAHRVNFRVKIRDIDLLSDEEAIFLLSRHAFGRASPPQEFEELSGKVVHYAAGLPLTVEVLGSLLCRKNEHEWVKAIDRLKEFPPEEILKKLELSYESLEYDYQQIFLDIACILKGLRREEAIRILVCCGFHARIGLKVLEQRSLITVDEDGELGMHDQIEEMGKNIVRREHRGEPNKHSRLWIKEEIEDILANDEGTEATICLKLFEPNTNAGTVMKGLGKMKQLRYLQVDFRFQDYERHAEDLDNTAQYLSNSLKYLKCCYYPFLYLPKTFQANNLVGLEMKMSRMEQLWEEGEKKVLPKLKFLSLNYCSRLTTFDFRITPNLETLSLEDSPNLVKLFMHVSCQKLNYLHISRSKLRTFDLGLTPNLEKLSLNDCADFEELHVSSACPNLKFLQLCYSRLRSLDLELFPNLERLDLQGCADFEELHVSSACPNLKFLNLRNSRLRSLDLELFPNLEKLELEGCADVEELHVSSACPNLKFLQLCYSRLRSLDLELFPNLEKLELEGCADFEELHVSGACPNLKFLNLSNSRLRGLDLELFPNLERLDLQGCDKLVEINAPVGCLRKLVYLILDSCLRFSNIEVFVDGLEPKVGRSSASLSLVGNSLDLCPLHPDNNLPKFQFNCEYEENLPSSVGNIEKLFSFGLCACTDFKKFSDMICSLRCLRKLKLIFDIPEFPEDLGKLECLEELCLLSAKIKHLPDSICMLKCLKSLKVNYDYPSVELTEDLLAKLPEDLGQLECLEELYVRGKKIEYLPDSICMLKRLKSLDVRDCSCLGKLPENIGQLESLERLDLTATMIKHLPDSICELKHLTHLILHRCTLLQKLPEDLGKLECLERLYVRSKKIEYLPDSICMLKRLKSLDVSDCSCLGKLPEGIGQLESLERLDLPATKIKHLPDSICELKRLKSLDVRDCSCLGKLPEDIGQLESLESLDLSATKVKHLPDSICELKHLTYLNLRSCALLEKLPEDIAASPKLRLLR